MSKFKVGDKVRCVSRTASWLTVGNVYTIVDICPENYWYRVKNDLGAVDGYTVGTYELVQEESVLTPEEVFEHLRKGTKLQVRHTGKVGHKDWCDVVKPELTTYEVMLVAEWRIKPEPEVIELNGKKYREIIE